ncbi:type II secretion system protein GspH [Candidatus Enterovibrio altilux]|uniref:type II secretion system protein GspH n=1 Tax=Candidatus Enterovibrio altilux TaxID=1927128 RepID=UPI001CC23290|nr:type II secretion system protein GspH [Candidatus Enterovibrio luxaltus]
MPNLLQNRNDEAKEEALRFYQLVKLWTEQALLTGQTFGLHFDNDHYALHELTLDNWVLVSNRRYAYAVTMPKGVELHWEVTGFVTEGNRLFNRENLFNLKLFTNEKKDKLKPKSPQVILMGNGEIIPFTLTFLTNKKRLWQVTGNDIAIFELTALNEDTM